MLTSKKLFYTFVCCVFFSNANAQELKSKKGENYLPEKGDWAISFTAGGIFEYLGNSFNGDTGNDAPSVESPIENTFVGKYFTEDKKAYRVVVNLEVTNATGQGTGTVTESLKIEENSLDVALGLGKEWRRGKTRLQGFYGADALITAAKSNMKVTQTEIATGNFVTQEFSQDLTLGIGVAGFIGAEYFLFPKMAIVAQYSYQANFQPKAKGKLEFTSSTAPTQRIESETSKIELGGISSASIGLILHF